ncbi:MAG: group 2 polymerase sigma-70 subunit SigB [Pseudomonadota bacterium]|jgi:RNA polymerase sigma factor (sigma-70 family)
MVIGSQVQPQREPLVIFGERAVLEHRAIDYAERSRELQQQLPKLADLVIQTDRKEWAEIRRRFDSCHDALIAEDQALQRLQQVGGSETVRALFDDFEGRKRYVTQLTSRAKGIGMYGEGLPMRVPILSRAQATELVQEFQRYRQDFWRVLYEVPGVQHSIVKQLRRVEAGEITPGFVLNFGCGVEPSEEEQREFVRSALREVEALQESYPSEEMLKQRCSAVASVLMRLPVHSRILTDKVGALSGKANEIADLEIALSCRSLDVDSDPSHLEQLCASWRDLFSEFGGGALVARQVIAQLLKRQEPMVRLKQYLTTANMPFIVSLLAKDQRLQACWSDMLQEGVDGFMYAIEKFDPASGLSLLTYAGYWVRQRVSRALEQQTDIIYMPHGLRASLTKLDRGIGNGFLEDPASLAEREGVASENFNRLLPLARRVRNFDPQAEISYAETVFRGASGCIEEGLESQDLSFVREKILQVLHDLEDPRDGEILTLHYGLDGEGERTFAEIGRKLGLSRERVRQLHLRALERLNSSASAGYLKRIAGMD